MNSYQESRQSRVYRDVYERHHGKIPIDENGRTYDIHHIDGDRTNNSIENLVALSIHEHYMIHYNQQDWGACLLISRDMVMSSEERSILSTKNNNQRVLNGTHNWVGQNHKKYDSQIYSLIHRDGTEFVGTQHQFGSNYGNVHRGHLTEVLRGNRRSANGWRLKTVNDKLTLCLIHESGKKFIGLRCNFLKEFPKIHTGHLSSLLKGHLKSTGGWKLLQTDNMNEK